MDTGNPEVGPAPYATLAKQMGANQDDAASAGKRRGNPNWLKGGPSPNPNGRPRTGLAQAELIREHVDPMVGINLMKEIVADERVPAERRLAAYLQVADRGFVRPPSTHEIGVHSSAARADDFAHLTEPQLRERLAWIRGECSRSAPALATKSNG